MIPVANALMLLVAAPGVILVFLSIRKAMSSVGPALGFWLLGAWLGGKAQVLLQDPAVVNARTAWKALQHHPGAPLGLWGIAAGSSLISGVAFALARSPKLD